MDVFDLSSQEEFSSLKPLTKRARRILTPAEDNEVSTNSVTSDEKELSSTLTGGTLNSQSVGPCNACQQREDLSELCPRIRDTTVSSKAQSDPDKQKKPVYIYSPELIQRCDAMPKIINRVYHTYSLFYI